MLTRRKTAPMLALMLGIAAFMGTICRSAAAQTTTATILGTVTDATGAAVPDASVKATDTDTGVSQTTMSDAEGRYRIPQLQIGQYEVDAEKSGFQASIHKGITLSVGANVVVDFALQVGQVSQAVTVEGEVAQVETTSSTISNLVEQTQMRELPLNGRSFEQLLLLAPGVTTTPNVGGGLYYGNAPAYSVSGSRANGQVELLDDTDINNYMNRGAGSGVLGTTLGIDAISEFQVLTNTYSPQFGGNGAVMNAVSRAGTNDFHGSAYEFIRNSALDAKQYFDPPVIPPFRRNQFGGTIGGPIKKDKMFFFFNYEGLRQSLGESTTVVVPDATMRAGLYPCGPSQAFDSAVPCGNNPAYPTDTDFATYNPTNFAHVQPYLNFFPTAPAGTPDNLTTETQSYNVAGNQPASENYFLGRYDWTISSNDSIFVRYLSDVANLTEPFGGAFPDLWPTADRDHDQFATIEEKHIFSNNLISTTHFGYSRTTATLHNTTSYPLFQFYPGANLPDAAISFSGAITGLGSTVVTPIRFVQSKFATGEDMIWTKGPHTFTFGGTITRMQSAAEQLGYPGGDWIFSGIPSLLDDEVQSFTGPIPPSQPVVLSNGQTTIGTNGNRDFREFDYATYLQDSWRATSSLTVNIGLRWAPTSNPYEVFNKMSNIIPVPDFLGSVPCSPPGTATCSWAGTVLVKGFTPVSSVYLHNPSFRNFDPRVGIAWDPFKDHKTSVRAGYGIFHSVIVPRDYAAGYYFSPPWATGALSYAAGTLPQGTFQQGATLTGLSGSPSLSFGFNHSVSRTPYVQQWNLSLQRQVTSDTIVTLMYVGSHSLHNVTQRDENPPLPTGVPGAISLTAGQGLQLTPHLTNLVCTSGSCSVSATTITCNTGPCNVASPNGQPLVDSSTGQEQFGHIVASGGTYSYVSNPLVNPNFQYIDAAEPIAWSLYNSVQAGVVRRLTKGLQAQVSYTYSHCTDLGSGSWSLDGAPTEENPYDPDLDDGLCSFDIRHNLTVNGMYILPFHGNRLVEGWQVAGLFTYHTGLPFNITEGFNSTFNNGTTGTRPNYEANAPGCNNDPYAANPYTSSGKVIWLNQSCFTIPPVGEFGNLSRNAYAGPNYIDFDPSVVKNTKVNERINVQFRAEFFNIFNRPNFGNPSTLTAIASGPANWLSNGGPAAIAPANANNGLITTLYSQSRRIQFGLKVTF